VPLKPNPFAKVSWFGVLGVIKMNVRFGTAGTADKKKKLELWKHRRERKLVETLLIVL
jgi:hypothetical protein